MSSNVESAFSYDSASVDVLVISNRAEFFKSVRNRLKLIFFMSLKFTCFLMGGGLANKSLQFTAEWSEIEGSMTSIFDTNLSSELVSN